MKTYLYNTFGLTIESQVELPELISVDNQDSDIVIQIGEVPERVKNPTGSGVLFETSSNEFLLKIIDTASYFVSNGNSIIIQPVAGAKSEEIRLFLLGSAIGALLMQRGGFLLHASAVAKNQKAVLISGVSSAGKSSLAAGLEEFGYSLIADDISLLSFSTNNILTVHPGIPHHKLWKDVIQHLRIKGHYEKVRDQLEKYRVPSQINAVKHPLPVSDIIVISAKNAAGFIHQRITGAQKFSLLKTHTYRSHFVEKMELSSTNFLNISKIINAVPIHEIERPMIPLQIRELASYVHNEILLY